MPLELGIVCMAEVSRNCATYTSTRVFTPFHVGHLPVHLQQKLVGNLFCRMPYVCTYVHIRPITYIAGREEVE